MTAVAVAPDDRTAYSASLDGAVIAWDLSGSRRLGRVFGAESTPPSGIQSESLRAIDAVGYHFGTDGETIAIARPGGFVNLVDARTLRYAGRFRAQSGPDPLGVGVEISPDGTTIVTSGTDGVVRFWDARTRTPLSRPLQAAKDWEWSPTFSGDGRLLATAGVDAVVRLWDARRHVEIGTHRYKRTRLLTRDIAMRPDGRALVVPLENGPGTGRVEVLAVPSLKTIARIPMRWGRWSRFSADGRFLVLGNMEGVAEIYDGHTFQRLGRPLRGHTGFILTADFSPDDRMLATSATDGTVRLWDTATGDPIGNPLPGIPNVEVGAAFVNGGTHVAAVYDGGRGYLWEVRPSSWARRACAIADASSRAPSGPRRCPAGPTRRRARRGPALDPHPATADTRAR